MNRSFRRTRWIFYSKIGLAYLCLWLFIDLVSATDTFLPRALNNIWRTIFIILINFWFFETLRKKLSLQQWLLSGFRVAGFVLISSMALSFWRRSGMALGVHTSFKEYKSLGEGFGDQLSTILFSVLFFGAVKHVYDYRNLKNIAQQLRIEKQEAELNYLKSQTNPHFLFNTLNNIYALAKSKSDLAPESILRLSKILRFMLYESSTGFISIEQELSVINDYIALEKLRYDDSLRINMNHSVLDMQQAITPLLLIPLVENAFKHGVSETRQHPFIDIHLSVTGKQLKFIVKNSTGEAVDMPAEIKENIGLSNLRRQLQLLYKDYQLHVGQSGSVFTANLTINLTSHV